MKIRVICSLGLALLAGCSSPQVVWPQDNQTEVNNAQIQLKSNLWLNKMPTIGDMQESNLHGALYLQSSQPLPADLEVQSVSLRQDAEVWLVEADDLELRTHTENQWEVVFAWQFELDPSQTIDVAIMLKNGERVEWLVEKSVVIDTVY